LDKTLLKPNPRKVLNKSFMRWPSSGLSSSCRVVRQKFAVVAELLAVSVIMTIALMVDAASTHENVGRHPTVYTAQQPRRLPSS
jgi:hypothetical protein